VGVGNMDEFHRIILNGFLWDISERMGVKLKIRNVYGNNKNHFRTFSPW
jgi:hypothetical protein